MFAIEQISGALTATQSQAQIHAAERARASADCVNPAGRNHMDHGRGDKAGFVL
ncbi:MAG: hypothetical protein WAW54_02015 [Parvibaculum sedimenti]|uniref:hypothetical protein n=1 Tax=Parvibaculum sedimenti TaxID=2608632 RepID=UPI003BB6759A